MGQTSGKCSIRQGDDKIIRVEHDVAPKRFPGGISKYLFSRMQQYKDNAAQIDAATGKVQSYADLLQRAIRTALEMRARGIKPKDIISICSHNHLDTVVPLYATFFLGAIPASLDPTLSLNDTALLIKQVRPKMVFASEEAVKLVEDALEKAKVEAEIVVFGETAHHLKFMQFLEKKTGEDQFSPEESCDDKDTAVIFFSSGTTGLPKGICLSHYGLLNQTDMYANAMDCSVMLAYSSLYWISAIGMIAMATATGGARLIDRTFVPINTWKYIDKYKITFAFLTVNACMDLYKVGRPPGINTNSFKVFYTGGERVSAHVLKNLRDVLPDTFVTQGYGQTEASGLITGFDVNSPEEKDMTMRKPESCGRPVPSVDMYKVADVETGHALGPHEQGELRIKGKFFMKGYHNLDSSVAFDEDGYMKTGDVVYYDEEFCFFIVDRIKEMLKYRSWHVAPAMLEEVLLTHPAVSAAVVVGIPDKEDGEHPMACVILKQGTKGVTEEDIRNYVDERVDDRKKLRGGVVFVKSFPTTATGKINRRMIKNLCHQAG